jgi:NAD-reducing hydrogenase small subunit
MSGNGKVRLATVWLDGCSGCHMSLLDTDERLIELAKAADVVWGTDGGQ